jgi:hypothetical protein
VRSFTALVRKVRGLLFWRGVVSALSGSSTMVCCVDGFIVSITLLDEAGGAGRAGGRLS